MQDSTDVYDLGNIGFDDGPASGSVKPRPKDRREAAATRSPAPGLELPTAPGPGPGLVASLSMFLPGFGQIVAGDAARGLCFLLTTGWAVATGWAIVVSLDRLLPTLDLLDVPRGTVAAALGLAALAATGIHVGSVWHAHALRDGRGRVQPHPVAAGLASTVVPGWGQVLGGHRVRAACFLSALWVIGAAWLLATPAGTTLLKEIGVGLPPGARDGWGPIALVTAPILVWVLAIYDAAAGAVAARR